MSLFDWVELGMSGNTSADKALASVWTGFVDISLGDALYSVIGSEYDQFFGPYVMLVCDFEDMLLSSTLEKLLPFASALLGGVGGNANFIYGQSINATYLGPATTISRAPSVDKSSDNLIRTGIGPPTAAGTFPNDPIDEVVAKVVGVMSVLMCALDLAINLTLHFKYPEASADEGYNSTVELLKMLSVVATSRLMALIKLLEEKGSLAGLAEQMLKEAKYLGVRLAALVLLCIPLYGWCGLLMWNANQDLDNALANTAAALKDH